MRHIIRGLTFQLIPILVNGILGFMRQPQKAEKGKVYLHKFLAILGTIGSAIFLIPAIITVFLDEPLWVPVIFLALASLGASLIIGFINCRISYDEDGFVAKNFLGIKRKFTYDQVTAIKENLRESYIYMGERRVMVDQLAIGGDEFIKFVKKKYRTMHDGQSLPKILKTKHDIFKIISFKSHPDRANKREWRDLDRGKKPRARCVYAKPFLVKSYFAPLNYNAFA